MKNKFFLAGLFILLFQVLWSQNWTHMGPFRDAPSNTTNKFKTGRADIICVDPDPANSNTVYLGSKSGGLWKTDDVYNINTTNPWININTANSTLYYSGVSALAKATGTNGPLYVADYNQAGCSGVYKYQNNTWSTTGSFAPYSQPGNLTSAFIINSIRIHPAPATNNQLIFVASNQGLFRSQNGGTTWFMILAGNFHDVAFMPRIGSSQYGYDVFVSGENSFLRSIDDGNIFVTVSSMQTYLSVYSYYLADITYTASTMIPGDNYIYILAYTETPLGYAILKFSYNSNTSAESSSYLDSYNDYGYDSRDRLAVAANDQAVYCAGGMDMHKYDATTGNLITQNLDVYHTDMHDVVFNVPAKKLFLAEDGGFYVDNYHPTNPDYGLATDPTYIQSNNGLNISQINGFSCAQEDENFYMTGEQDNVGTFITTFIPTTPTSTSISHGYNETPGCLIDHENENNLIHRGSSYDGYIDCSTDQGVNWTSYQTNETYSSSTDFCTVSGTGALLSSFFSLNTFFQDPNRSKQFYFGGSANLHQYCPSSQNFMVKYRAFSFYNSSTFPNQSDKYKWCSWIQSANGMAFSRFNKNKTYFTLINREDPSIPVTDWYAAQVFAYTGADIDDSWIGHNEGSWTEITPNFIGTQPYLQYTITNPDDIYNITFPGIAASDWNPNRIWVACANVPQNPQVKVLMRDNNGNWIDYSTGIPQDEIPVSLVYEQGSNDQLYLGTNRNVYVRDASMSSWIEYTNNDLPHVRMSQLQINYKTNTLRAGTYGCGVWQSALRCPVHSCQTFTNVSFTNSAFEDAYQCIVTFPTTTVTGGEVYFRSGGYVDLYPGFQATPPSNGVFYGFIHNCGSGGNSFRETENSTDETEENPAEIINNLQRDMRVSVYPNPNSGIFTIVKNNTTDEDEDETGKNEMQDASVFIYDMMGNLIYSKKEINGTNLKVDMSSSPKGIYLMRYLEDGEYTTIKVVNE